ncbi:MAG TPA: crosslink repair DNA glycosylase YcaQ family protein [Blastocatellia bacterium]|nr:crosslink repair DNA glycosylase YcaQ family protein [Blastocatellia bacterium]
MLAHAGKDHLVERKHYKRVYRNQGWITRAVLQNGRVIGNWSATRRGTAPALEIELFEKASKAAKEKIKKEASSLGTLLREAFLIKLH